VADAAAAPRPEERTIAVLAALVGASIEVAAGADRAGIESTVVTGLDTVDRAKPGELTFVGNAKFAKLIPATKAVAVVVSADLELSPEARAHTLLVVKSADLAMMAILERFAPPESLPAIGVDPAARVDPGAHVDPTARIAAGVTIARGARIGPGTTLFPGVAIYEDATISANCVLHANVVVRERCIVGNRVILASGVAIGTDGFGYRPSADGRGIAKIPHIGNVVLEDDVEIGANTCVDRGKFGATRIGMGTKIDNLCQIGHNVEIGRFVVMSGLTGVAGSTRIGDGCRIGGGCGIADHLTIGRGVSLAARSGVMSDIPDGATWGGFPAQEFRNALREIALVRKLPEWHRQLRHLLEPPKAR
jgi:UDP-3-O-[3-hydroxymyristoyl] glucosamine N-acyltransferase